MGWFGRKTRNRALSVDEAATALLTLQARTPYFSVTRTDENVVRVIVCSIDERQARPFDPSAFTLQMEVDVRLKPEKGRYSFKSTWYERAAWNVSREVSYGRFRNIALMRYFSVDGATVVRFDTGEVFRAVDDVLVPLGWR